MGRGFLRALGWKVVGEIPDVPKAVFIASPHTSNYDGMFMVATAFAMNVKLSWMGKKSLFTPPALASFFRAVGGISIDRSKSNDTVQQIAAAFAERDAMFLAIAPAGTREKRDYWKSGFYQIALRANVPVICGCVDYARKEAGVIGMVELTGDASADMDKIRAIYEGHTGRHPSRMGGIRLHAEDAVASRAAGDAK
jgi:1-acyl-sn-glycerol-3-phosphate acyltransferase